MKLSIVIPSYNNSKWLDKCFNSILEQTFTDYEVIVVDDMSTDDSMEIIKKYKNIFKTKGIKYTYEQCKSKRLSGGTRNEGILKASGEYILCIDSDDWLIDNEVLQDIANTLNGEDVMFLDYIAHQKNYDLLMQNRNDTKEEALHNIICAIWTKVVKRDLMLQCLFPEGTLFEDRIQHYEVVLKAKTITNFNKPAIMWNRLNDNSTSGNNNYLWNTYRFSYIGELYRLYNKLEPGDFKNYIKTEINHYMDLVKEMVDEL